MLSRLYEILVNKFGFSSLQGDEPAFYRRWEQEVEVVWYGKQTSVYEVFVYPMNSDTAQVVYQKNGQTVKRKYYSFGYARTLGAIQKTVEYAGFKWEVA